MNFIEWHYKLITLGRYGIKAIAMFEGIKGMLVLALVLTFIMFFNSDAHAVSACSYLMKSMK